MLKKPYTLPLPSKVGMFAARLRMRCWLAGSVTGLGVPVLGGAARLGWGSAILNTYKGGGVGVWQGGADGQEAPGAKWAGLAPVPA
jgi:hypothetical protein